MSLQFEPRGSRRSCRDSRSCKPPTPAHDLGRLISSCRAIEHAIQLTKLKSAGRDVFRELAAPPALSDLSLILSQIRSRRAAESRRAPLPLVSRFWLV